MLEGQSRALNMWIFPRFCLPKKLPLAVGAHGLMTTSKNAKPTPIMWHPQNENPKFLIFLIETRRLSKSLEGLNSSLVQLAIELRPSAKMAKVTFCRIQSFMKISVFEPVILEPETLGRRSRADYFLVSIKHLGEKHLRFLWLGLMTPAKNH